MSKPLSILDYLKSVELMAENVENPYKSETVEAARAFVIAYLRLERTIQAGKLKTSAD